MGRVDIIHIYMYNTVFSERDGSFLAKDSESPTSITTGGAAVDPIGVCGEVLNVFNSLTEPSL